MREKNKWFEVIGHEPNGRACIVYDSCLLIVAYVLFFKQRRLNILYLIFKNFLHFHSLGVI